MTVCSKINNDDVIFGTEALTITMSSGSTPTPTVTTTWNNPLRSLSRTSSVASTISSSAFVDDDDKKPVVVVEDSLSADEQALPPPVQSVSTTTTTSIAVAAASSAAVSLNIDKKDSYKTSPQIVEKVQQEENSVVSNSNMVHPIKALSTANNFLCGKLVLVTGGSGTIGMAIATGLVKQKASVVLTGRNVNRLKSAVEKIRQTCPDTHENSIKLVCCDVTKEDSVMKLFNTLDVYKDKRVDILINNAGMNIPGATEDLTAQDFEKVMAVNVLGPFLCSREVMKRMKLSGLGGRIINIGSLSAHASRPDSAPYTTSKFALRGLTESLALDGRSHNIAVGMIHPGNVQSDLLTPEQIIERKEEGFLQPQQVADCVVHMCSLPYNVNIQEMTILPTGQPFVGRG